MAVRSGNVAGMVAVGCGGRRLALVRYLGAVLVGVVPGSCANKPVHVQPPVVLPDAFSEQGDAAMPEQWWRVFGDEQLDHLIDEALRGNFTVRIAWDRLDQAHAVAAKSGAALRPSTDGSVEASRSVRKGPGARRVYGTEYSLGLLAGYEVDLWGRIRSTHDAAQLDAYAASEDIRAAAITVSAEIARTWYQLVEQRGQLTLLDEQIKTNEQYLEVITLRFRRGQVSATDVLQQRQLVESTRGERLLVESAVMVLEHQLAALLGRVPGGFTADLPKELPELPPLPQTGLPVELIRRRPDVLAAEARVRAAEGRLAAAIADQFPKLGLTISTETSVEQIRSLFDNWAASVAANLVAPLLDGGLRAAEVERTEAVVSEQLNSYGQVVLTSLKEVEDALSQETQQERYVASLGTQLDLSRKSTEQTLENYTKGKTEFTFIRYLTTVLAHQRLQRKYLQAKRELVQFRIDLYRALAGSWAPVRPGRAGASGARLHSGHEEACRMSLRIKQRGMPGGQLMRDQDNGD